MKSRAIRPGFLPVLAVLAGIGCRALSPSPPATPVAPEAVTPAGAPKSAITPTPAAAPAQALSSFRLVGYYSSWSIYARAYPVAAVPAGYLTHLNYAFAGLSESGECTSNDPQADKENFPELQRLKAAYPHLRILISVGGQGSAPAFSPAAQDEAARRRFAESCVRFMLQNGFDGIDIDWEFPDPSERLSFTALLTELRRQLDAARTPSGPHYLLTIAAGASPYQYDDIDLADLTPLLDWVNLMAYNFHGSWSGLTGFNAPLYASPGDRAESEIERRTFNLHSAVLAFLQRGVPARKIVAGAPFFGRSWGGVPDSNRGLYQPFETVPELTRSLDYREIQENYLVEGSGYTRYWDIAAQVPWLYSPSAGVMISYDDPQSLQAKAEYVRTAGLGGIMVWQLAAGDPQGELLKSLFAGLAGQPASP